jgi:hypothetical protein
VSFHLERSIEWRIYRQGGFGPGWKVCLRRRVAGRWGGYEVFILRMGIWIHCTQITTGESFMNADSRMQVLAHRHLGSALV